MPIPGSDKLDLSDIYDDDGTEENGTEPADHLLLRLPQYLAHRLRRVLKP